MHICICITNVLGSIFHRYKLDIKMFIYGGLDKMWDIHTMYILSALKKERNCNTCNKNESENIMVCGHNAQKVQIL